MCIYTYIYIYIYVDRADILNGRLLVPPVVVDAVEHEGDLVDVGLDGVGPQ